MKNKELLGLSTQELIVKEKSLREELFKLNIGRYSGRVDKPHMFSVIKKQIAQIETILNGTKAVKAKE